MIFIIVSYSSYSSKYKSTKYKVHKMECKIKYIVIKEYDLYTFENIFEIYKKFVKFRKYFMLELICIVKSANFKYPLHSFL